MKVTVLHFHHPDPFPTHTIEVFIREFYEALQAKDFAPIEKLDKMIQLNRRIIGIENPPNEIYC